MPITQNPVFWQLVPLDLTCWLLSSCTSTPDSSSVKSYLKRNKMRCQMAPAWWRWSWRYWSTAKALTHWAEMEHSNGNCCERDGWKVRVSQCKRQMCSYGYLKIGHIKGLDFTVFIWNCHIDVWISGGTILTHNHIVTYFFDCDTGIWIFNRRYADMLSLFVAAQVSRKKENCQTNTYFIIHSSAYLFDNVGDLSDAISTEFKLRSHWVTFDDVHWDLYWHIIWLAGLAQHNAASL